MNRIYRIFDLISGRKPGSLQLQRHETAVRVLDVRSERTAKLEPKTRIELSGWFEIFHRPRFQAEPGVTALPRMIDQMLKHPSRNTSSLIRVIGSHRFNFAMRCVQLFQCAASRQPVSV